MTGLTADQDVALEELASAIVDTAAARALQVAGSADAPSAAHEASPNVAQGQRHAPGSSPAPQASGAAGDEPGWEML